MQHGYAWKALTVNGARTSGWAQAASEAALQRHLEAQGMLVLTVRAVPGPPAGLWRWRPRRHVIAATRALSSLLSSGLPLSRALDAAADAVPDSMAEILRLVRADVERGESLAAALARQPACFDRLYIAMISAGERSGDLAGSFARLTAHLERNAALRARLTSSSIYPLLLGGVGITAISLLVAFVLPRFVDLLSDAGATVPRTTQLLIDVSAFVRMNAGYLAAGVLATVAVLGYSATTLRGQRAFAIVLVTVPILSALRKRTLGARFARLLAVLLEGGTPLVPALKGVAVSIVDPLAADDAMRIRAQVREGRPLHAVVAESRLLPPLVAQLLRVGEETASVPAFAGKAADLLEEETDRALQRAVTLLEPIMIVAFGLATGFVALSLLQAIYGVNAGSFR